MDTPEKKKTKVFISYAWESEEYKKSVKELASFLKEKGGDEIEVIIDQDYEITPPEEGFLRWMVGGIKQSDKVLLLCSKQYAKVYQHIEAKTHDESIENSTGNGVIWEAIHIYQGVYDNRGLNTKFYPVLPPSGSKSDIPDFIRTWSNNLRFNDSNEKILQLILGIKNQNNPNQTINTNPNEDLSKAKPIGPGGFIKYEDGNERMEKILRIVKYFMFLCLAIFSFHQITHNLIASCIFSALSTLSALLFYIKKPAVNSKLTTSTNIHNGAYSNTNK